MSKLKDAFREFRKNKIFISVVFIFIIGTCMVGYFTKLIYGVNVKQSKIIYIYSSDGFNQVVNKLTPYLNSVSSFKWLAKIKKYNLNILPGKYGIKKGMNNNTLINKLRNGEQDLVNLKFSNLEYIEKIAGSFSKQIEADSLSLLRAFKDSTFLARNNLTEKSILGIFIPNTYQVYWNTSAEQIRDRMLKEYRDFWTENRIMKAKKQGLTPEQVIILASIVHKETSKIKERPIVAGLYLNRLKKQLKLESDPTIIYAVKEKKGRDYRIRRVLYSDLETDSPFNTYKNEGLPPAPIAMSDISAIDAVLNPKKHEYLFMCASVDRFGYHEFANTLVEHKKNTAKYRRWIEKQNILR